MTESQREGTQLLIRLGGIWMDRSDSHDEEKNEWKAWSTQKRLPLELIRRSE